MIPRDPAKVTTISRVKNIRKFETVVITCPFLPLSLKKQIVYSIVDVFMHGLFKSPVTRPMNYMPSIISNLFISHQYIWGTSKMYESEVSRSKI